MWPKGRDREAREEDAISQLSTYGYALGGRGPEFASPHAKGGSCDGALIGVNFKSSPGAVRGDLPSLVFHVSKGVGGCHQVIAVGSRGEIVEQVVLSVEAPELIPSGALVEPPEKRFDVEEEEEGGEGVPLQCAPFNRDAIGGTEGRKDARVSVTIDAGYVGSRDSRHTEHSENGLEFVVVDHVEGGTEVDVEKVDVFTREMRVFDGVDDGA